MWRSAESSSRASCSAAGGSPRLEPLGEVAALDVLHHQVRPLAGVVVVDRDQVRVLEPGGDARLALEAAEVVALGGQRVGEHLDRDRARRGARRWPARPPPCRRGRAGARAGSGRRAGGRTRSAAARRADRRPPARLSRLDRLGRQILVPHDLSLSRFGRRANPGNASPSPPRVGTDHESHDHQLHPEALPRDLEHRGAGRGRRRGAARARRRDRDRPRGRPRASSPGSRPTWATATNGRAIRDEDARLRDPRDRDPDLARAARRASPSGCSSGWTRCSPRPTTRAGRSPTTGSRAWSSPATRTAPTT